MKQSDMIELKIICKNISIDTIKNIPIINSDYTNPYAFLFAKIKYMSSNLNVVP